MARRFNMDRPLEVQAFRMHVECIERRELECVIFVDHLENEIDVHLPHAYLPEVLEVAAYARKITEKNGFTVRVHSGMERNKA